MVSLVTRNVLVDTIDKVEVNVNGIVDFVEPIETTVDVTGDVVVKIVMTFY